MLNEYKGKSGKRVFHLPSRRTVVAIIIAVMLVAGAIAGNIGVYNLCNRKVQELQAMPVATTEQELDTIIASGEENFIICGIFQADNPVGYPDVGREYIYAKGNREERVRHKRSHTSGKIRTTSHYYSWDVVGTEEVRCNYISALGLDIPCYTLTIPAGVDKITTVSTGDNKRYVYYGCRDSQLGAILVNRSENGAIREAELYSGMNIQDIVDDYSKQNVRWIIVYWACCCLVFLIAFTFIEALV
mgnify:CR=1 FL=1